MKFRCRLSLITCSASGSIHVVTNVARLRAGIPSTESSSVMSRCACCGVSPDSGISWSGADWSRNSPAPGWPVMWSWMVIDRDLPWSSQGRIASWG